MKSQTEIAEAIEQLKKESAALQKMRPPLSTGKFAVSVVFDPATPWQFRVVRRCLNLPELKAEQREQIKTYGASDSVPDSVEGMTYVYTHNGYVVSTGGGTVMLGPGDPGWQEGWKITPDEWAIFQSGKVPRRLLSKYFRDLPHVSGVVD